MVLCALIVLKGLGLSICLWQAESFNLRLSAHEQLPIMEQSLGGTNQRQVTFLNSNYLATVPWQACKPWPYTHYLLSSTQCMPMRFGSLARKLRLVCLRWYKSETDKIQVKVMTVQNGVWLQVDTASSAIVHSRFKVCMSERREALDISCSVGSLQRNSIDATDSFTRSGISSANTAFSQLVSLQNLLRTHCYLDISVSSPKSALRRYA